MEFVNIFPVRIRQTIPKDKWDGLEEIRIRAKLPVEFLYADRKSLHFGVVEKEEIRDRLAMIYKRHNILYTVKLNTIKEYFLVDETKDKQPYKYILKVLIKDFGIF